MDVVIKDGYVSGYCTKNAILWEKTWYDYTGKIIQNTNTLKGENILHKLYLNFSLPDVFVPLSEPRLVAFTTKNGKNVAYITYDRYREITEPSIVNESKGNWVEIVYKGENGWKSERISWQNPLEPDKIVTRVAIKYNFWGNDFLKEMYSELLRSYRISKVKNFRKTHWLHLTGKKEWAAEHCEHKNVQIIGYRRRLFKNLSIYPVFDHGPSFDSADDHRSLPVGSNPNDYYYCTSDHNIHSWFYCKKDLWSKIPEEVHYKPDELHKFEEDYQKELKKLFL